MKSAMASKAFAGGVVLLLLWPGQATTETTSPDLMKAKLISAQKTLEALVTENYDELARHARKLKLFSQEAAWNSVQTPEYREYSRDFRRACDALSESADEKMMDRAGLAYVQLTLTCVQCHSHVRRHQK